jgi:hypothetical protein
MTIKISMKRWDSVQMRLIGTKLFASIHRQKRHTNPNQDIHFMARQMDEWLDQGIDALIDGSYTPRFLKRYYFKDAMVDQPHLSDRIFQHILLKQLKPTFPYVMMAVLKERKLSLSRKKTRIGLIDKGFHFLGIHYPGTQLSDNTNTTQMIDRAAIQVNNVHYPTSLNKGGGRYCNY